MDYIKIISYHNKKFVTTIHDKNTYGNCFFEGNTVVMKDETNTVNRVLLELDHNVPPHVVRTTVHDDTGRILSEKNGERNVMYIYLKSGIMTINLPTPFFGPVFTFRYDFVPSNKINLILSGSISKNGAITVIIDTVSFNGITTQLRNQIIVENGFSGVIDGKYDMKHFVKKCINSYTGVTPTLNRPTIDHIKNISCQKLLYSFNIDFISFLADHNEILNLLVDNDMAEMFNNAYAHTQRLNNSIDRVVTKFLPNSVMIFPNAASKETVNLDSVYLHYNGTGSKMDFIFDTGNETITLISSFFAEKAGLPIHTSSCHATYSDISGTANVCEKYVNLNFMFRDNTPYYNGKMYTTRAYVTDSTLYAVLFGQGDFMPKLYKDGYVFRKENEKGASIKQKVICDRLIREYDIVKNIVNGIINDIKEISVNDEKINKIYEGLALLGPYKKNVLNYPGCEEIQRRDAEFMEFRNKVLYIHNVVRDIIKQTKK